MSDTESSIFSTEPPNSETRPPGKSSGGNAQPYVAGAGRFDGMEARIASIEAHVDHMRDDLGDLRRDFRELAKSIMSSGSDVRGVDDRVSYLPGKGWMFTAMLLFTAIICAVVIYLEQIRQYLNVLLPISPTP